MRDIKYIIKRVIIGVGIVLVLSCLNGCKVKALDTSNLSVVSSYRIIPNGRVYDIAYDRENDRMYIYPQNDPSNNIPILNISEFPYFYCWNQKTVSGSNFASAINGVADSPLVSCVFSKKKLKYYYLSSPALRFMVNTESFEYKVSATYQENAYSQLFSGQVSEFASNYNVYRTGHVDSPNSFGETYNYKRNGIILSNYDIYNYSTGDLWYGANLSFIPGTPEFVSWNSQKIVNNNILLGYNFKPEFTTFDTTNYVYQYKIGSDSNTWLSLTENRQSIDVRGNTILYVRVKDLQDNIIDSATFTVSGVGSFTNNQNINYDIKFSGEYRTRDDLNYNESSGSAIIEEYQIYTDFVPNSSILKYQYQWVPTGGSLDSNSWVDINLEPTDYGDFTYVVNLNGTFYARILDSENNLKYSATFTVNTIGKLAIDSGNDKITNKFMSIADKLNIGGPISGLIEVPLKVINIISTGLAGGLSCTDYSLGSLWGTNLVIPCVNVKQHLGSSLYNTIDIIIACVMIFYIYKMIMNMYTNFVFMQKNPVQELGDRGD